MNKCLKFNVKVSLFDKAIFKKNNTEDICSVPVRIV